MNELILREMNRHGFNECDVVCTLGAIAAFNDADSALVGIGQEATKILDVFCYYDDDNGVYKVKKKYFPLNDSSLFKGLLNILRDRHGFTEKGVPPLVFDFNIYKKEPTTEGILNSFIIEGHMLADIAQAVTRYYETTQYPTTIGKYIENGLEGALTMGEGDKTIEGLV